MRVKHNANVEFIPSLSMNYGALMSLHACKTQYKQLIHTIARHHLWCPHVASMRAKHNTNNQFIPLLRITYGVLMSPQCVQNTIQTLIVYHPSPSIMVP